MIGAQAPAGLSVHRVLSAGCWSQSPEALIDFAVRGDCLADAEEASRGSLFHHELVAPRR